MYAIIETGGRQYTVSSGDTIKVDLIPSGAGSITIDRVLAIVDGNATVFGAPYITGAAVKADILGTGKAKKVLVYKKRPRRVYEKLRGHRQPFTTLKIKEIHSGG
jgi:large subunit ribosomal protein L21